MIRPGWVAGGGDAVGTGPAVIVYVAWLSALLRSLSDEVIAAVVVTVPLARTRTVAVTLVLCMPSMNTSGHTDVRPDEIWQPEPFSAYVDTSSSASGSVKANETLLALAPVAFRSRKV